MGNIGPGELLIIALIALLLFGAGRIADIGKGLGQGIKNFKQGLKDADTPEKPGEKKTEKKPARAGDDEAAPKKGKSEADEAADAQESDTDDEDDDGEQKKVRVKAKA